MRGLKVLVVAMGVLIVAGLAVIAITIVKRSGNSETALLPGGFQARTMEIAPGAEIVASHGAGGRLVVRLRLADGRARFLFIDPATGRLTGRLDLAPGEAAAGNPAPAAAQ